MVQPQAAGLTWAGRIASALVVLFLLADGAQGLLAPQSLAAPMAETGFPVAMLGVVSVAALVAAIVYAVPRTAVLGAILITAFAGGAVATHLRVGSLGGPEQIVCVVLAALAWGGLWLRDPRVRGLLPTG